MTRTPGPSNPRGCYCLSAGSSQLNGNLQVEYVQRLTDIVTGHDHDYPSQSMALYQLREIERMLGGKRGGNTETRAHTQNVLYIIRRALEEDA